MEFSSIWFFSISSLASLIFLTTGVYCLDKARSSIPHDWFMHQIQSLMASSVIMSISYAFLIRPPLEHQEIVAAPKLIILYGFFHPSLIHSLVFPFYSFYTFFRFHNKINLIYSFACLLPMLGFLYLQLKKVRTQVNGNGNLLARIASPLLLYPYHSLSWISFIVLLFFSLGVNFEHKGTPIFPTGECLSLWGFFTYSSSVLQCLFSMDQIVLLTSSPKSSILIYVYERSKMLEIILSLLFVILAQYFSKEKSLPLMFAFMSFAITWLGNLANVQPRTDLGIFHFFVSSSMECAVNLFGLHVYTFLVFCVCIILEILRWKIEYVSLRRTGIRKSVFLDWVILGQCTSSSTVVAQ